MTDGRQTVTNDAVVALIEVSLVLWERAGDVRCAPSGAITVRTAEHTAEITRAAPGVPFRWSICVDGRYRHASSVPGLLRALRMGLDPEFRPSRVRIAPIEVAGS